MNFETPNVVRCRSVTWSNLAKQKYPKPRLSFFTINARSLKGKFNEIVTLLSTLNHKFSFIAITETWLNSSTDLLLEIPGYKSYSVNRDVSRNGGGIKFYYLDHIDVCILDSFTGILQSCESLFVEANVPGFGKLRVCSIYRPPNLSMNGFLRLIEDLLVIHGSSRLVLMGDFNSNVLSDRGDPVIYKGIMESFGLTNEINLPTYVSPSDHNDRSCLDHVWTNLTSKRNSFVIKPNISDHYAVCSIFEFDIHEKPKVVRFRDFNERNILSYERMIAEEFSSFSCESEDPNYYSSKIVDFLHKIMNKYFPIRQKTISIKRIKTPWITTSILRCINKKHRWYRMFRQNLITHESYKKCCNALRYIIDLARCTYYQRKLNSLKNDQRKNWRLLNSLLNRGIKNIPNNFNINDETCTNPQMIAEKFNNHFLDHPKSIHDGIPASNENYLELVPMNSSSIVFDFVTDLEVDREISNLKKQGDKSDVLSKFLKLSRIPVSKLLCNLFNLCLLQGSFPENLKHAFVTPVFKKGSPYIISNYRPISIVSNISKIFESLIYKRLSKFFSSQGLLSEYQFGFRRERNTELAIFTLVDRVIPAIQLKEYAICVFLDFSACFDTLCRDTLIAKLYRYGVRGPPLELIKSYFKDRTQSVNYGGISSNASTQSLGVIQGSRCGPLYYDVYSSDLKHLCSEEEFLMFADDTSLVYTGNDLPALTQHVNQRLSVISDWCKFNKLSLNGNKCQYMLITTKKVDSDPIIKLEDVNISRVSNLKYLGVQLDDNLKFHDHIEYLCGKMYQLCGVTFRLRDNLNLESAKNVYYSCIYSVLKYCIGIWGGVLQCTERGTRLIALHRRVTKNLFAKFSHGVCVYKSMKVLKLPDIHRLHVGLYMYKVVRMNACPTLQLNLDLRYPQHDYGTRNRNNPIVPFPRVDSIKINFQYQCTKIWSELPPDIRDSNSLGVFKRKLIEFFLAQY